MVFLVVHGQWGGGSGKMKLISIDPYLFPFLHPPVKSGDGGVIFGKTKKETDWSYDSGRGDFNAGTEEKMELVLKPWTSLNLVIILL